MITRGAWLSAAAMMVACGGKGDTADTASTSVGGVMASGTITAEDGSYADVNIVKAFAFASAGTGLVYAASGEGATCETVAEYLDFDTAEYDPTDLWPAETCNLFLRFSYDDAAGWDGLVIAGDDPLNPWVITCAMDAGSWEYGESNGFFDYYYTGRYFQGGPEDGTATFSGTGESMSVALSFSSYLGGFTYELMENVNASGTVSGTVVTEWCTDLGSTGWL